MEQINQVLSTAAAVRLVPFAILAFTGMRAGDCQRLRPEDIDLLGNWIHVVHRDGGERKDSKTLKVPIHRRLRKILETVPGVGVMASA